MVGLVEAGKLAFKSYRKDLISSILFGLIFIIADILKYIPIVGAFIGACLIPRILRWYYSKTIGNVDLNYKLSFKTWLSYLFIMHLSILIMFTIFLVIEATVSNNVTNNLTIGSLISFFVSTHIIPIILFAVWIMFYYPRYASLLGRINEFKINHETIERSIILIFYSIIWSLSFLFIRLILLILSFITENINIILFVFIVIIFLHMFLEKLILELVRAHKTLSI